MGSQPMSAGLFESAIDTIKSYRSWLIAAGLFSVALGTVALFYNGTATTVSVVLFGWLLTFAGVVQIVYAFQVTSWSGFFLYLLDGIIRATVGTLIIMHPGSGAQVLTLLLSFYFIVAGVFRTIGSMILQFPSWGWSVASGLLSVALGVMLAMQWPTSGQWFIGLAVGLDLVLYGWALLMFAAAVKKLSPTFA